jgi:polyferredoxin
MKKAIKINPYRLVLQLIILTLLVYMLFRVFFDRSYTADFEAYCPYGGLLAFSSFLVNNSLACSMTSAQIAMGAAFLLGIILFSKLFCSFICPVGSLSEWLGKIGERFSLRYTIKGYTDLLLRGLKYAILFITIYYTVTSSELFCKKFDPYYAAVTGFGSDVSVIWGVISIVIVIAGSFFIRLFWCKYLCPVGAIANIFRFFITFLAVTGIYLILSFAGVKINFAWPLAVICIIAYLLEFYSLKSSIFPLFRIKRDINICTGCKLCTKVCPQAIDVESLDDIKHIDCNLCADCIQVCPEKDALTINRKGKKWLPAFIVVILIAAGILIGKSFEIPTLSQYWGDKAKKENMSAYTRSGLKSVKCFGSSAAFANQIMGVKGVTGVTTFVKTNKVIILFDPEITDTVKIPRAIFNPVKVEVRKPGPEVTSLDEFSLKVDNFFDPLDAVYLKEILSRNTHIYGFTTEFDCPVRITIFADSSKLIDKRTITDLIEKLQIEQPQANGKILTIKLNYRVKKIEKSAESLSISDYASKMNFE